ncbi:transglutaminase TgpA family protein [Roseimaritima ulvae]|uniref:Protein-glutamine gamma-glutamyltransferase n=1 Tax=Roseimaritima ulvae TaxID=980254 RepID=A0A5B9R7D6_9BACT|nr:DUF3488 and transglutaminase-like domain-containing protein [Roseimaritima ulvae]QEG42343.1 Protein-glutamine gamma-glutamyltransferase [Roseimaritima ulvae]
MQRLEATLKVHFALLAALSGLILGFSDESGALTVIAVCSSVFAFVFVDWLKLFALPPALGYLAMGLIAVYCIGKFIPLTPASNQQLLAVAQLLVLVQAVLMLQAKSRRTFEQIGIFSLLEIVVAAVFNHALTFALLLIPIAVLGIRAMVLLQAYSVSLPLWAEEPPDKPSAGRSWIKTRSPSTVRAVTSAARRLPRSAIVSLGPAVLLVALVFFYAIPRTAESDGIGLGGAPQVGFSDTVTLNQIGHLQQNPAIVMRVKLQDADKGTAYQLSDSLYLRGRTLNLYDFRFGSGNWRSTSMPRGMDGQRLPPEFQPSRTTDQLFYDRVNVEVSQQPQNTRTAFSVPPYYRLQHSPPVRHTVERWLMTRVDNELETARSRVSYRYGTHAFRNGRQLPMLRAYALGEEDYALRREQRSRRTWWRDNSGYDPERLPELTRTAQGVVDSMAPGARLPYHKAMRLNQYVTQEAGLRYTLDLNFPRREHIDPVEEFLTINRGGHCQYFASTLALMLRSQGIPSRLVIGYKTEEYSPYGEHYIVRQSHAHVWVEAFLEEEQVPKEKPTYGQPATGPVWLRLDPTPGSDGESQGQVTQAMDFAQGMWEKWVLDMGGRQQEGSLAGGDVGESLSPVFAGMAERLKGIRRGELGGGALAGGNWFSWPAAAAGVVGTLLLLLVLRVRLPQVLLRRRAAVASPLVSNQPQLDFFTELCNLLRPLGVQRQASQTPREFVKQALHSMGPDHSPSLVRPLQTLTNRYYAIRFGNLPAAAAQDPEVGQALEQVRRGVPQPQVTQEELPREDGERPA